MFQLNHDQWSQPLQVHPHPSENLKDLLYLLGQKSMIDNRKSYQFLQKGVLLDTTVKISGLAIPEGSVLELTQSKQNAPLQLEGFKVIKRPPQFKKLIVLILDAVNPRQNGEIYFPEIQKGVNEAMNDYLVAMKANPSSANYGLRINTLSKATHEVLIQSELDAVPDDQELFSTLHHRAPMALADGLELAQKQALAFLNNKQTPHLVHTAQLIFVSFGNYYPSEITIELAKAIQNHPRLALYTAYFAPEQYDPEVSSKTSEIRARTFRFLSKINAPFAAVGLPVCRTPKTLTQFLLDVSLIPKIDRTSCKTN